MELNVQMRNCAAWIVFALPIFALYVASSAYAQVTDGFDIVISGGTVVDPETRLQGVRNVGIRGSRIEAVSTEPLSGKTNIDATGLIVAPGFVDLHAHGQDLDNSRFQVMDGVTTACEMEIGVPDIDAYYETRAGESFNNFGATIGHVQVRMDLTHDRGDVVPVSPGAKGALDDETVREVWSRIERGLRRGALGVGMGLQYTPGASREEVQQMFAIAKQYDAAVYVHIRHFGTMENTGGVNGLEEVITAAAMTGASLHVVHINSSGARNAPLMLSMVQGAAANGIDVTTECYPYGAGMTNIGSALFDGNWQEALGIGYGDLQWVETGERLTDDTYEIYRRKTGMVILHMNPPEIVDEVVLHPITMIASDGRLRARKGHPRSAGTYSKALRQYVRESGSLSLMQAIGKMSLMPARRLETRVPHMRNKGRLQAGADADIVVFDIETITDHSTYEEPAQFSEGMRYVFVNGVAVVEGGVLQEGIHPGNGIRALRR